MTEEKEENLSLNKILNIKKEKETNSNKSLPNEMVGLMNKSNDKDRQILLPKEKKNKQKKKSKKSKNEKDAEKVSKAEKKQKDNKKNEQLHQRYRIKIQRTARKKLRLAQLTNQKKLRNRR
ncbi:hypothetical protein TKK_0015518 [Trichogramma kaykai]